MKDCFRELRKNVENSFDSFYLVSFKIKVNIYY